MAEEKKVDITGLMVEATPGWEARVKELCKAEFFQASIEISEALLDKLSFDERKRLYKKLKLVEQAATYMAAGMLKGTLKYPTDNLTVEQWMAHVVGEGADQFNYEILLADAFFKERQAYTDAKKDG